MASNTELYLSKALGEDVEIPRPTSRIELQLARLLGEDVDCPAPQSRVEKLLEKLYENGFSGGSTSKGVAEWTKIEDLSSISKIEYGNGLWVAACCDNGVYYSEDGKTWTHVDYMGTYGGVDEDYYTIYDVKYNGSVWVACGRYSFGMDNDGDGIAEYGEVYDAIYFSDDGKTWSLTKVDGDGYDPTGSGGFDYVFYNNGVWHVSAYPITSDGYSLFYSVDGRSWDSCTGLSYYDGGGQVEYIDGVWYCTTDNSFHKSTDGKSWTCVYAGNDYQSVMATYGNGTWVLCDHNSESIKWSTDLSTWTDVTGLGFSYGAWVYYVNGIFLAIEDYSGLKYSTDGKVWSMSLSSDYTVNLGFAGEIIFGEVVHEDGSASEYYTSTDGITWTSVDLPAWPDSVYLIGDKYVANMSRGILYSDDGISWTESNVPMKSKVLLREIATSDSMVLFYGSSAVYYAEVDLSQTATPSIETCTVTMTLAAPVAESSGKYNFTSGDMVVENGTWTMAGGFTATVAKGSILVIHGISGAGGWECTGGVAVLGGVTTGSHYDSVAAFAITGDCEIAYGG